MPRAQSFVLPAGRRLRPATVARRAESAPTPAPSREPAKHGRIPSPSVFVGVFGSPNIELLRVAVRGSRTALACPCGAQARRVDCTHAETARFGGERFARAFVCTACGIRYVGRARP